MNLEEEPGPDPRVRWLRRAIWALILLGLGACLSEGANSPADPYLADETGAAPFGEIAFRVQPADRGIPSTTEFCALHADTTGERAQGLMHRDDLGGYDAMVFTFDDDTTSGFHMRNTRIPLTVAWFDAAGGWVGSADMDPCPDGGDCPAHAPPGPYRVAVEVARDDVARFGFGPETRIEVGGGCGT